MAALAASIRMFPGSNSPWLVEMRLSKIKLAGFKSFVDPTQVRLPSNLIGIVGPNGCGKSNIIDAVRWVLGESSAKHLRGGSMADVIFNGSTARKPVGQSSVELTFDNSDGAVGGEYAKYAEIAIKRLVTRDGDSAYFLNGARCRRRDVIDLFLGTGLGPRSYAIIEQGMISKIIEAKPEELRGFLEEAAGISRYKERRRETEGRMRQTQENLERLGDLREEVSKQLQSLLRQARTAERYKELKQQERQLEAELLALRLRAVDGEAGVQRQAVTEQETALEAALATQRRLERELEEGRQAHGEATEALNRVQGHFYEVGAQIARLEQAVQHLRELRGRGEQDLAEIDRGLAEVDEHLARDRAELEAIALFLAEAEPALVEAQAREEAATGLLQAAEAAMHDWQVRLDDFKRRHAEPAQVAEVERSRMEQIERQITHLRQRLGRQHSERLTLDPTPIEAEVTEMELQASALDGQMAEHDARAEAIQAQILALRAQIREQGHQLDQVRHRAQGLGGRLASLRALQQAALDEGDATLPTWLADHGLADRPRLAQGIEVEAGWERAAEVVLGDHLGAVCVEGLEPFTQRLDGTEAGLALFDTAAEPSTGNASADADLASKVTAPWTMAPLLAGVRTAEDLGTALAMRADLATHESVVTRTGVRVGANWLRITRRSDPHAGVLAREHEIRALIAEAQTAAEQIAALTEALDAGREALVEQERQRDRSQAERQDLQRRQSDLKARLAARRARLEQVLARRARLEEEIFEVQEEVEHQEAELSTAKARRAEAMAALGDLAREGEALAAEGDALKARLADIRAESRGARERAHGLALEIKGRAAARKSLEQNLQRMQTQRTQLAERHAQVQRDFDAAQAPLDGHLAELAERLEQRVTVEAELTAARQETGALEARVRSLDAERHRSAEAVERTRAALERGRLELEALRVRREGFAAQLEAAGYDAQAVVQHVAADASVDTWETSLHQVQDKVQRLGAINLAAIDEYQDQSQRKEYLDAQYLDLTQALTTLENAIRKIDRETRTRFKETFDRVNGHLQALFPRLFGGGHAFLELSGEDLLDTGITIMARPPGKRITTIHLLSGGEKALTAVALVFAFFQLNPAPFCLLDEVDAPLDEANVGRFCDLVRELSDRVQFLFISHNKVTMEMAHELLGVTMHEPGVSRLVAVDVEEAVKLAAV